MKNHELEKAIADLLTKNKLTLSTAESCTGGLLAHRLTNIPRSSDFFIAGFVTYSKLAKQKILKLDSQLLKKYGTVSYECAKQMAKNVKKLTKTDIGLSITGVAGPDRIEGKSVGEVFIGIAIGRKIRIEKFNFKGKREEIKYKATSFALKLLKSILTYKRSNLITQ